jgi:DHA2 family multidrug resistance protein
MQAEQEIQEVSPKNPFWAFFAMVVGMFMAVLDIQIVASSLSVIAAGLSASGDELSWIQTSYLIAEVIIIPITGFSARLLSTRISYFYCRIWLYDNEHFMCSCLEY